MKLPIEGAIDCDVHPAPPSVRALLPYLDAFWRDQITNRHIDHLPFTLTSYPPGAPFAARPGLAAGLRAARRRPRPHQARAARPVRAALCHLQRPARGHRPLQRGHVGRAVLGRQRLDGARAARPRAAPARRDPGAAAEPGAGRQGDRARSRPTAASCRCCCSPWARRRSAGASTGRSMPPPRSTSWRSPSTPAAATGWRPPTRAGPPIASRTTSRSPRRSRPQLLSLVAEGVFQKFPGLKVVMSEAGFTWLPNWFWRAGKTWRGVRAEVPWVDRAPAEIVADHVRFTLQPVDAPATDPAVAAAHAGAHRLRPAAAVLHRLPALALRRARTPCPTGSARTQYARCWSTIRSRPIPRLRDPAPKKRGAASKAREHEQKARDDPEGGAMNVAVREPQAAQRLMVVDCDIHPTYRTPRGAAPLHVPALARAHGRLRHLLPPRPHRPAAVSAHDGGRHARRLVSRGRLASRRRPRPDAPAAPRRQRRRGRAC